MTGIRFAHLDLSAKRAVFWLANEVEVQTPTISAAAKHVGEIWEAFAFLKSFPKGTPPHTTLADRLRLGKKSVEGILDCIRRAAPTYRTLGERADDDFEDVLAGLSGTALAAC